MKVIYLTTNGDTTTILPYPLEVQGYGCGVFEMDGKISLPKSGGNANRNNGLFLCCNIVEESFVGNIKMPVLRYIKRKNANVSSEIQNVIWLKVMRPTISSIRLYITDEHGEIVSLPRNYLSCTLLFTPAPQ